jgi:hypothetical protein
MFWTDLLSIIRSLNTVFTAIGWNLTSLADNITSVTNTYCCEYSIKTPDYGRYICPKYVGFITKIKLINSASCWLLL